MKQVLIIHGGDSFSSYDRYIENLKNQQLDYARLKAYKKWKPWIAEQMPEADVLLPTFPNGYNAVFDEWKIYFEKILPLLQDDVILVGHSLGGMFLAKYLQDNTLAQPVNKIVLVAARYGNGKEDGIGSFEVTSSTNLGKSAHEVHLFHSEDDPVVPFDDVHHFQADTPGAVLHTFTDRGHFNDATFPELLELLQKD